MIVWSRRSDRTGERVRHLVIPVFTASICLADAVASGSPSLLLAGIVTATAGTLVAIPVFWSMATASWPDATIAAAEIAAVNAISSLASFLGPYATGALTDATGGFHAALLAVAATLTLTGVATIIINRVPRRTTKESMFSG